MSAVSPSPDSADAVPPALLERPEDGKTDLNEYLRRSPDAVDKAMIAMMAGETR